MADQCPHNSNGTKEPRGSLDSTTEDVAMADAAAKEKHTLMDELQRTRSHSSSSGDEEADEGGERRKKKKKKNGLNEAIKDKITGDKEEETVPDEECKEEENGETVRAKEKTGFLEKIKEILPGQHNKGEEETTNPSPAHEHSPTMEKKSIIDKIKEKLPCHHKKNEKQVEN